MCCDISTFLSIYEYKLAKVLLPTDFPAALVRLRINCPSLSLSLIYIYIYIVRNFLPVSEFKHYLLYYDMELDLCGTQGIIVV